ncbi:MAG: ABC transporter ATP-binding protein [Gammaproteobacteria bacterium]|jgi:oligopeptide/dipeptide ABC transporter ATP-binding protein|nr:ABC transporter ATP-binding protein [Gammaproteobacteria bacterium]MCP4880276.1 ABC transporter ATP-binding protein [Gammaproteobacteria bacterium]MDP6166818.1 ABC transporter ATP-binding protein [Gammaproteobacteria bacterium]MDP6968431.1 ABC transporter ATP-binding protein [Gammaproteobacteria bacterium]
MSKATDNVLSIRNLSIDYATQEGSLKALRNVDLDIPKGQIVGVVGESGCGKSTLISSIIQLMANNAKTTSGTVFFEGEDLLTMSPTKLKSLRGQRMSIVFQDPMSTLNPVLTIGKQMVDIQYRDKRSKSQKRQRSADMLAQVGIPDPASRLNQYPHEFSGGMQQRISIAMALQAQPALLIADEPTTALDATLEVQIIDMLKELQSSIGCSILFISHHLGVIAELCNQVVVMYAGEIVEQGPVSRVFKSPKHPYTQKLLECDPASIAKKTRNLPTIEGEIPNLSDLPAGCIFTSRCHKKTAQCEELKPKRHAVTQGATEKHFVTCHLESL